MFDLLKAIGPIYWFVLITQSTSIKKVIRSSQLRFPYVAFNTSHLKKCRLERLPLARKGSSPHRTLHPLKSSLKHILIRSKSKRRLPVPHARPPRAESGPGPRCPRCRRSLPGRAAPAAAASAALLAGGQAISASRWSPDSICSSSAIYSTSGQKQGASSINITLICKDIFARLDRLMLHRAFKGCGDKERQ